MFVPLVSEAAIEAIKAVTPGDKKDDNVLLEYEHAIAMHTAKRLAVLPVLIGWRDPSRVICACLSHVWYAPIPCANVCSVLAYPIILYSPL